MSRRHETKRVADLVREIEAAGGEVMLTARKHLRVTGPAGIAHVSARRGGRCSDAKTRADILRHAGIDLTPDARR